MPDQPKSLWAILDSREAAVGHLRDVVAEQLASLEEKEGRIHVLDKGAREMEAELRRLQEKERMIESLRAAVAEAYVRDHDKEDMIESLRVALAEAETRHQDLAKTIEEREFVMHKLEAALAKVRAEARAGAADGGATEAPPDGSASGEPGQSQGILLREIQEKEAIIADQRRALIAYRAAFFVGAWLIHSVNWIVLTARGAWRRLRKHLTPRLGVLYQHSPHELRLPERHADAPPLERYPRIAIVTPSFGQAAFIERTIESVLAQDYPELEYFVQDGGSTDGTAEILARYAGRLTGWESKPDTGQTQAINVGFGKTSGEIMAWLNSDDVLFPGALACVADFFNRHPDVDVVYSHRILIDEKDLQIGTWILPGHDNRVLSWADFVPQETLFWRRAIWEKAGGYVDESFRFAMDWDLLVRFREAGARFARLPRFLGGFRVHPKQKTSAGISDIGFHEMNLIRKRVLGRTPSAIDVRRAVAPYLAKHVAADIGWRIRNRLGMNP